MTDSNDNQTFMPKLTDQTLSQMAPQARALVNMIRNFSHLEKDDLKEALVETISPDMMFHPYICPFSHIWTDLRKLLAKRGVKIVVHEKRRAVLTLANSIYDNDEDRERALELAGAVLDSVHTSVDQALTTPAPSTQEESQPEHRSSYSRHDREEKTLHNVGLRLKDEHTKYRGDFTQCLQDHIDIYEQTCRDYKLTEVQKLEMLHHILQKDAYKFFISEVRPNVSLYKQAIAKLNEQYNSATRQNQAMNLLGKIKVAPLVKDDVSEVEALSIAYKKILDLSRQAPAAHNTDIRKRDYLRAAVIGFEWARTPLSRINTRGLSFQDLYTELEAECQLYHEFNEAKPRPKVYDRPTIHFAGQGRLHGNRRNFKRQTHGNFTRKRTCFNCGSENHLVRHCTEPVNYTRAAASHIRRMQHTNGKSTVHFVLAHLCRELDDDSHDEEHDHEGDEAELFEHIVDTDDHQAAEEQDKVESEIHISSSIDINFERADEGFWGACLDSGAQLTVIGSKQCDEYCSLTGSSITPTSASNRKTFRFGANNHKDVGVINIRLPLGQNIVVSMHAHVLPINIPLLLGLDVMEKLKVTIDFANGKIYGDQGGWAADLNKKCGHLYLEWPVDLFYSEAELQKIHRHFFHPSTDKLHNLILRADDGNHNPNMRTLLEKVRNTCSVCQRHAGKPHRFRVAIPDDDCVFNKVVGMDLMKLYEHTVLHVVDRDTKFSSATFTLGEMTRQIWEAFLSCWVAPYVGFPDEVVLYQGPQFQSQEFRAFLTCAGIKRRDAGVESHNALGETERYHAYLCSVYTKVREVQPELPCVVALTLATKACNDTAGPKGLVPTLLVFGVLPRLPVHPKELPNQRDRMDALHKARAHMSKLIAQSRLATAQHRNVPSAADSALEVGDLALVYRDKPVDKWLGPYRVLDIDGKAVALEINGKLSRFSIDRCKPYGDVQSEKHDGGDEPAVPAPPTMPPVAIDGGDTESLDMTDHWRIEHDPNLDIEFDTFVSKIVKADDPRALEADFDSAKRKEVDGLIRRQIWTKVKRDDVPTDANVIGGRFVLTLKNAYTPEETAKVRYIAQGYSDADKPFLVHDVVSLRPTSIRILLCAASVLGLKVFLHDVNQAYLQSKEPLARAVYLKPKEADRKWFAVCDDEVLKLDKPLYGLCDSGDYWNATMTKHITKELGMTPCTADPSLYMCFDQHGELVGLMGNYVDDSLNVGNEDFERLTEQTMRTFECEKRCYDSFAFFGTQVDKLENGNVTLTQEHYCKAIEPLRKDASMDDMRRTRALLAWLTHTRPDICCVVNKAAQVTQESFCGDHVRMVNRAIRHVKGDPKRGLVYVPLDRDTMHIKVYTDASYATNDDLSSQIGYLVLLCDGAGRANIIEYSSKKSRPVVRSIMGGELYAFVEGFDAGFSLAVDIRAIFNRRIKLIMLTDSKQVFDVITPGKLSMERRLAIDVKAVREAYFKQDIDQVGLVAGADNPADGLSKVNANKALNALLDTQCDSTPVAEWIVRN